MARARVVGARERRLHRSVCAHRRVRRLLQVGARRSLSIVIFSQRKRRRFVAFRTIMRRRQSRRNRQPINLAVGRRRWQRARAKVLNSEQFFAAHDGLLGVRARRVDATARLDIPP